MRPSSPVSMGVAQRSHVWRRVPSPDLRGTVPVVRWSGHGVPQREADLWHSRCTSIREWRGFGGGGFDRVVPDTAANEPVIGTPLVGATITVPQHAH
jgi:hypothetical protein